MESTDDLQASYEQHRRVRLTVAAANKATVFAALQAANIARVSVVFEGEGDEGQIGDVMAWTENGECSIPDISVRLQSAFWGGDVPDESDEPLRDAIETMCYNFLDLDHGGWESGDGACGEFLFDVAEGTIELEFNSRYIDVHTSSHSF